MSPDRTAATYQKYSDRVRAIVRSSVAARHEDVDDALSFAWVQFLTHEVNPGAEVSWLATTATREAIRLTRHVRQEAELPDDYHDQPGQATASNELLRDAIASLAPQDGRVLLCKVGGYTIEETAQRLGVGRRAVLRGLREAREALRTGAAR